MKRNERSIMDRELGEIMVRVNVRSKRIVFRSAESALRVTMPPHVTQEELLRAIDRLRERLVKLLPSKTEHYTAGIVMATEWLVVELAWNDRGAWRITGREGKYLISAPRSVENVLIKDAIYKCMSHRAREVLLPLTRDLAAQFGFSFAALKVNSSKTRWGSCSMRKNINLSCSLMKLPAHLVRFVVLHELCHTVYLNHGASFYALLDTCVGGQTEDLRRELRGYSTYL